MGMRKLRLSEVGSLTPESIDAEALGWIPPLWPFWGPVPPSHLILCIARGHQGESTQPPPRSGLALIPYLALWPWDVYIQCSLSCSLTLSNIQITLSPCQSFLWRHNLMKQLVPVLSTVASIQKMVNVWMLLCNFPKVTLLEKDWVTTETQVSLNKILTNVGEDAGTCTHSVLQKVQNKIMLFLDSSVLFQLITDISWYTWKS